MRHTYSPIIMPHTMRHNYAIMCWERGLDPYTTMRLMGHSSIKVTMDIYTHINDRQLTTMREKVDELFKKSCTRPFQTWLAHIRKTPEIPMISRVLEVVTHWRFELQTP